MRALLTTTGSEGDFQPFLALAQRLRREGHDVVLAAADRYRPHADALEIPYEVIGDPWSDELMRENFRLILAENNPLKQLVRVVTLLEDEQKRCALQLRELARACDVVVYPPLLVAAAAAARAIGKPHVSVHLAPLHRARSYAPTGGNYGSVINGLLWSLAGAMMRKATDASLNAIVTSLGLPPWRDVLLVASHSELLDLVAVSPAVLARDPLTPAHTTITGYWFVDEASFVPSAELAAACAGEPPVVIGFGSMTGFDAAATTRAVIDAVRDLDRTVVLQSGWAGLGELELPPHVVRAGFVPHAWLHARAACVVHHGGAGTTASALRAGVPQAIVWHLGDQPTWGRHVRRLGVAPPARFHKHLDATWLRATLDQLLTDEAMRNRARALGKIIRAEDGTGVAVRAIERALRAAGRMVP